MSMDKRPSTKLVRGGNLIAEVDVVFLEDASGWSPYLSLQDAAKLDDVRAALKRGDVSGASRLGRVYRLEPVG